MKKILLVIATHGDEKIGIEVLDELRKNNFDKFFDVLVANPNALEKKKRFLDIDMNRVYPGDKNSKSYEKRKAFSNLKIAKKYKYVFDIHEANCGYDDFIIIPKTRMPNSFPVEKIKMDKMLFWPEPKGSMSGILENAVEIEFGSKGRNRKEMRMKLFKILKNFINSTYNNDDIVFPKKKYYVYGKLMKDDLRIDTKAIKDFQCIINNGERFFPLLTGQYIDDLIVCYKMKRI